MLALTETTFVDTALFFKNKILPGILSAKGIKCQHTDHLIAEKLIFWQIPSYQFNSLSAGNDMKSNYNIRHLRTTFLLHDEFRLLNSRVLTEKKRRVYASLNGAYITLPHISVTATRNKASEVPNIIFIVSLNSNQIDRCFVAQPFLSHCIR